MTAVPRVSVVLPTHNRAALLPRSIHSVLAQTYADFELLVVDDGSTDATADLVAGIGDPRVRYVPLGANRGASAARNAGIDAARGELIAFQDSDDEWLPEKLELQVRHLDAHPQAGLVFCSLVRVDSTSRTARCEPRSPPPRDRDGMLRSLLRLNFIWTQTWLVRASVLSGGLRFDPRVRRVQDWDLALRIACAHPVTHLPQVLVVAHATPGSLLTDDEQRGKDLQVMLATHAGLLERYPDVASTHRRHVALWAARYGEPADARRWSAEALALAPFDARNLAAWALVQLAWLGREPYRAGQRLALAAYRRLRGR